MNKEQIKEHEEMKEYILKRIKENGSELTANSNKNIKEIVYSAIDFDREFILYVDKNKLGYTNDDEIDYIQERTGLEYSFIDMLLWYKYCFEMENDYWRYNSEPCLSCNSNELVYKEMINGKHFDKIVCKNCGCEMFNGPNGLEKL